MEWNREAIVLESVMQSSVADVERKSSLFVQTHVAQVVRQQPSNVSGKSMKSGFVIHALAVGVKLLEPHGDVVAAGNKRGYRSSVGKITGHGKADVLYRRVMSISWSNQKSEKVTATVLSTFLFGKQQMALFLKAMSYIISMASSTIIALRTWRRCLARNTTIGMTSMINALSNSKLRSQGYGVF